MPTLRSSKKPTIFHKIFNVPSRILTLVITGLLFFSLVNFSCSKFDTTNLGSDLLPVVDNINTFADTLSVITSQGVFNPDTTALNRTDDFVFGSVNDPLFGQTNAGIFFQLKPSFFPYYIGGAGDTLNGNGAGLDSVVLCLKYRGFFGDSTMPLQVQVNEVVDANFRDSVYNKRNVNFRPNIGQLLGTGTVDPRRMADSIYVNNGRNVVIGQIRIKLSQTWAQRLYNSDSLSLGPNLHAFATDSAYRYWFNGLAVSATGINNSLIYTRLADTSTRLEIHFRRRNLGRVDTLYTSLSLNSDFFGSPTNYSSGFANYVQRLRPAFPNGSQELYLQTTPGTFATLSIPGLSGLNNRIIHRAEIIVQQITEIPESVFRTPNFLYLDLQDSTTTPRWKPIYHDLNPAANYDPDYLNPLSIPYFPSLNIGLDYNYFGGYRRTRTDPSGNIQHYYNFNISRYVQDIVTLHRRNYNLRLMSPSKFDYPQYGPTYESYGNSIAFGRVKVGGGSNPNPNYRLMLRIVYSKL